MARAQELNSAARVRLRPRRGAGPGRLLLSELLRVSGGQRRGLGHRHRRDPAVVAGRRREPDHLGQVRPDARRQAAGDGHGRRDLLVQHLDNLRGQGHGQHPVRVDIVDVITVSGLDAAAAQDTLAAP